MYSVTEMPTIKGFRYVVCAYSRDLSIQALEYEHCDRQKVQAAKPL